jgi:ribosomal protein S18 acetylase RimI-like enzyme
MQFQSFQPFNRYAPFMPWWHHPVRHCGALGMGSLTGYRGRGLGKAFLGAGLERAVQARVTRVELKAREDNLRALAL